MLNIGITGVLCKHKSYTQEELHDQNNKTQLLTLTEKQKEI